MSISRVLDASGNVQPHTFQIGGGTDEVVPPAWATRQHAPLPVAPVAAPMAHVATQAIQSASPDPKRSPSGAVLSTKQLLADLRARLRVVEREIKVRKSLDQERDQIRRLIKAAQQERDNVRRIRAAG
jgi:hypothetical protein